MTERPRVLALLHYAGPPVVGGVESVMNHHARLMNEDGHSVRILGGRGEAVSKEIPFYSIPLIDSQQEEILQAKQQLDVGNVPDNFEVLVEEIKSQLLKALDGVEILFAHNVFTMSKNLMLTEALWRIAKEVDSLEIVAWHHDIAGTAARYSAELHSGAPWDLVSQACPHGKMTHVAVSKTRQKEFVELTGTAEENIRVIPSGVDTDRLNKFEAYTQEFCDSFRALLAKPMLLLPVRITRRKNIEFALRITHELGKLMPGATLVVTGPPGAHNPSNSVYLQELRTLRKELDLEPPREGFGEAEYPQAIAHFLSEFSDSFLPDEVIADFYRLADALLFTSVDEGFGIPVIEAGLARLPIFCSNIPPFKEIAGDLANYFSLNDSPDDIAARIATSFAADDTHALRHRVRATYNWGSIYQQRITPLLEITS